MLQKSAGERTIPVRFNLDDEYLKELRDIAVLEGKNIADVIREAVDAYNERRGEDPETFREGFISITRRILERGSPEALLRSLVDMTDPEAEVERLLALRDDFMDRYVELGGSALKLVADAAELQHAYSST